MNTRSPYELKFTIDARPVAADSAQIRLAVIGYTNGLSHLLKGAMLRSQLVLVHILYRSVMAG